MPNHQYQSSIFQSETHVLKLFEADLEYLPEFHPSDRSWALFQDILDQTQWRQDRLTVYGKEHLAPRLSCWYGEPWMDFSYSNQTMSATAFTPLLLEIKADIEARTGDSFNSVLVNYYRDGQDSVGWHSDDEPELGRNPVIASLSLGAPRDFHLKHKVEKAHTKKIVLEHGSLLMMRGLTQSRWQHQIPKRANAQGRINLTFRTMFDYKGRNAR
jgi:alkylated DNA repair dioxygenase AlkB